MTEMVKHVNSRPAIVTEGTAETETDSKEQGTPCNPVRPILPGLKGIGRVCAKSLEKYKGDFRRVTDYCRMTFECATLSACYTVLEAIEGHLGKSLQLTIVQIKDRLLPEFGV